MTQKLKTEASVTEIVEVAVALSFVPSFTITWIVLSPAVPLIAVLSKVILLIAVA